MNCPKCGKSLKPQARRCTQCGTVLTRKSDALSRKMTLNRGLALACGGLMVFVAVLLFLSGSLMAGGVLLGLGAVVALIGRKMGG